MRSPFIAVAFVAFLLGTLGCPPPPQPSSSPLDQTIIIRSKTVPVWFANVNNAQYSWQWGQVAMGNVTGLALGGANTVDTLYNVSGTNTQNDLSVLAIFARDPREVTDALDASDSSVDWELAYQDCALPRVKLMFPAGGPSPAAIGGPWWTSQFFPACQSGLVGPAADPDGLGSIKSVRTYRRGQCSTMVEINPVVDELVASLQDGIADVPEIVKEPQCTDVNQISADGFSYLTHQSVDLPDSGPTGGFALLFHAYYHHYIPFAVDTGLDFNYRYELQLAGGRLAVAPRRNTLATSGFHSGDAFSALAKALDQTIPDNIARIADERQVISPPILANALPCKVDGDCGLGLACLPSADPVNAPGRYCRLLAFGECVQPANPFTGVPGEEIPVDDHVTCAPAMQIWADQISAGAGQLGLSVADQQALVATANAVLNGTYTNWRCQQATHGRADATEKYRCQYVVKAKRLNVYPRDAELVWFDEVETGNPAFAAYAALVSQGAQTQLCTSKWDDLDYFHPHRGDHVREEQGQKQLHTAKFRDNFSCFINNVGYIWNQIFGGLDFGAALGIGAAIFGAGFLPFLQ